MVFDTCSFPEEMTVASVGKLMSYSYDSWSPADFEQRLAQFQLPKSKTVTVSYTHLSTRTRGPTIGAEIVRIRKEFHP